VIGVHEPAQVLGSGPRGKVLVSDEGTSTLDSPDRLTRFGLRVRLIRRTALRFCSLEMRFRRAKAIFAARASASASVTSKVVY